MAQVYASSSFWALLAVVVTCALARPVQEMQWELVLRTAFPNANVSALYDVTNFDELFMQENNETLPTRIFAACPTLPAPADTNNVNNLRPGNIKVVMAMGDSITAGMSAKDSSVLSLKQYRGLSYSIGGDTGVTTLPNLLKPYLPSGFPIGFSTGIGDRTSSGTGLNAAVSGAINSDMLGQAQWLVQQLQKNTKINIKNDWKVLSLWIGSNNLCDVCDNAANNNGANFETQVTSALEYLYANVPRLFVNLVSNLEISTLYNINGGACSLLHSIACGCVGSSKAASRALVASTGRDYQARALTIAQKFNSRNNPEFTVVVQPFLSQTVVTDRLQLSAADCFHPSAASHQIAAVALWNNLFVPTAHKKTAWAAADVPVCPTADSIFATN